MSSQKSFPELLRQACESGASDIHLMAGAPVRVRVGEELVPLGEPLTTHQTLQVAAHILERAGRSAPSSLDELARTLREEDCAYSISEDSGRFRVNISKQRGSAMIVLRAIASRIPTFAELNLPEKLGEIALEPRGLVLVTGATGCGKTTTLASMVQHIATSRACKIITIEDPIEFMHRERLGSVAQREVGTDTNSFADAMRAALRQDPDVILVGELRDTETVDIVLKAAETGHLVLSTVHTPDAPRTINRLVSFGNTEEQALLRIRLADCINAIISQRLLPCRTGRARVPALEILRSTESIRDCIANPQKTGDMIRLMGAGRDSYGMQTFDQHLMELYHSEKISLEVALAAATSPGDFKRALTFV